VTIGSLFSGIGGLELGLERATGARVVWQVERDAYCRHVLARHWPDAARYDDVRTVGAHNLAPVDLLCGGFPCQDLSAAGRGAGFGTEDAPTRSGLWYEMRRVIDELRPTWVVAENVAHTWRRYVPVVRRSLWELGYASLPLRVRACDVGARHERSRMFLVASPDHARLRLAERAHLGGDGDEQRPPAAGGADDGEGRVSPGWGLPPRPWMVRGVHGLPGGVDGAWVSAGWTGARLRTARIHALGNSVVPACAEVVGRLIAEVIRART
jgi:DNA (cytosine-5)-methyltransferase 1